MPTPEKRIPVTADRYRELDDLKGPDQPFDELLGDLVEASTTGRMMHHIDELREDQGDFLALDEA